MLRNALNLVSLQGDRELNVGKYRFRAIDAIRGVAAFVVVVWHFSSNFGTQPFSHLLLPFYTNGQTAVDVFFVISGFVLMHTYRDRINARAEVIDFILKRLARLYPLHVITLFITALVFLGFVYENNQYGYIYIKNDTYHFFLNILMIQYVGLQSGWSFNGPSWTMSTEFWINILFGMLLLMPRQRMIAVSAILCTASAIFLVSVHGEWLSVTRVGGWLEPLFIRTSAGFFVGVITYEVWRRRPGRPWHFIVGVLGVVVLMSISRSSRYNVYIEFCIAMVASPLLVYGAASFPLIERASSHIVGTWIGNISFSVYMWHYPIACIFVLLGAKAWQPHLIFLIYCASVFLVSTFSVRVIEFPLRRRIVDAWQHRPAALARYRT